LGLRLGSGLSGIEEWKTANKTDTTGRFACSAFSDDVLAGKVWQQCCHSKRIGFQWSIKGQDSTSEMPKWPKVMFIEGFT